MIINGNLGLQNCSIESLGEIEEIYGALEINDCKKLKSFGELKKIEFNGFQSFFNLPKLKSLGRLKLVKCFLFSISNLVITKLPENLTIDGHFFVNGNKTLAAIPNGLKVSKDLNLSYSNIKEIGNGVEIGGNLNLEKTNIFELPIDLKVDGKIIIGTNIKLKKFVKQKTSHLFSKLIKEAPKVKII